MSNRFPLFCLLLIFSIAQSVAWADPVDFARDIQPIFESRCNSCHGSDEQEGNLRLDARAIVFHGGVSGPAVLKGDAKKSLLFERIIGDAEGDRMPLDDDPLTAAQIELIRRWIDEGARWPDGVGLDLKPPEKHWAYEKPVRAELPKVSNRAWPKQVIDYYVLNRLDEEGFTPSSRAEKARLLRRVYLDLVGLPPSLNEVQEFVADESPDAFERVVDRLLASPMYGTKWARSWLDLARYADSNGYQADQYRNVWPYRDWVINAMNADMPFDQFTIEQLAGDLLPGSTVDQKIATGFHRLTTCNVEAGVDPEENRTNQIIDRINTTGTVWLGTTIECTQCHTHKYDPFTQKEYYQLFAFFNNTPLEVEGNGVTYNFTGPKMDLPLSTEQQARREKLKSQIANLNRQLNGTIAIKESQQDSWEKQVAEIQRQTPKWHILDFEQFKSSGGAAIEKLADKSVLVKGDRPDKDIYTLTATTKLKNITGFKLETLTDDSLPGKGPGRHDPERPNFVLNEFRVVANRGEMQKQPLLELHSAKASFSQARFDVAGAVDNNLETAWAINPQFGKPHWATFLTKKPIENRGELKLHFSLHQNHGGCRNIGRLRISAMTGNPGTSSLPDNIATIIRMVKSKRSKKQRKELTDYFVNLDDGVKKLRDQIAALQKQLDTVKPTTTLVMIEQDKPRMTSVFKRGSFLNKGRPVEPGTPRVLHSSTSDLAPNRLGFARWMMDANNPLVGRVAINRWWAEIFGKGIVATQEDFGTQGERPTHPRVLDYLARDFADNGWSMKQVHRTIVTSAMYQQSSKLSDHHRTRDPNNNLYARAPRFRLSAEIIRDNALAISGLFSPTMGGHPIYPPQPAGHWRHVGRNEPKYNTSTGNNRFRRGIYVVWRRSAPYPSFTNFDAPDRASCVVNRPNTNTATQALTLLNDPAYIEMAVNLAARMADRSNLTIREKVEYGFRLTISRKPIVSEIDHLEKVYLREQESFQANTASAKQLLGALARTNIEPSEHAAWFFVANILLNLDESINKG